DLARFKSLPLRFIAAKTIPYPPTTPINGAPLTFIDRIAAQTWSTVRIRTYTSLPGNLVVSTASKTPFFHRTGSSESPFFPGTSQALRFVDPNCSHAFIDACPSLTTFKSYRCDCLMTLEVLEAFLSKNKVYLKEPEKLMELREK